MHPDASCPACGEVPEAPTAAAATEAQEDDGPPDAPWHFKAMLLAVVVYLLWRGVQGLGWLVSQF